MGEIDVALIVAREEGGRVMGRDGPSGQMDMVREPGERMPAVASIVAFEDAAIADEGVEMVGVVRVCL